MKHNQVNKQDAIQVLKGVGEAESSATTISRSPTWLISILSCCYALMTFSNAKMAHENNWAAVLILTSVLFGLACVLQFYINYLKGVSLNLVPKTVSGNKRFVVTALVFTLIFVVSRLSVQADITMVGETLSILNGLLLAYCLYHFPSMDSAGVGK